MTTPGSRLAGVDPRLYLVTDTAQCRAAGRTVAETVQQAIAGGVGIVQVRDKDLDDTGFRVHAHEVISAVDRAVAGTGRRVPVVINDRLDVARRLQSEGAPAHIHIGQSDAPVTRVREILGEEPLIGLSVASSAECVAARESGVVDLISIGPVYDTSTKTDAPGGVGPELVGELVVKSGLPATAIGGITSARARELKGLGLIGICVVSAICSAEDPEAAAAELLTGFDSGGT